MKSTVTIVCGS